MLSLLNAFDMCQSIGNLMRYVASVLVSGICSTDEDFSIHHQLSGFKSADAIFGLLVSLSMMILTLAQCSRCCCCKKKPDAASASAGAGTELPMKEGAATHELFNPGTHEAPGTEMARGIATGAATQDLFGAGTASCDAPAAGAKTKAGSGGGGGGEGGGGGGGGGGGKGKGMVTDAYTAGIGTKDIFADNASQTQNQSIGEQLQLQSQTQQTQTQGAVTETQMTGYSQT